MERPKKNPQRVRARYTKEFKLEAVRLLQLGQKPATELALEFGIRRNQLHKWAEDVCASGAEAPQGVR
jgi:transposase